MSLFREIKSVVCADPLRPTAREQLAASISAAVMGQFVANPLDVLKVRLMADVATASAAAAAASAAADGGRAGSWMPHRWRVWKCLRDTLASEGLRGLYKGTLAGMTRSALSSGTGLGVYAATKQTVTAPDGPRWLRWEDCLPTHIAVSALSALVSTVASAPADTIKTRLMNQRAAASKGALDPTVPIYSGVWDCAAKTARSEGVRALYRGVGPNFLRVVPWQIVFFATYEALAPRLIGGGL
jgi:hypothetical protein